MAKTTKKKSLESVLKKPALQRGIVMYRSFQDRPPYPEKVTGKEGWEWVGWMLARADDVQKIIEEFRKKECGTESKEFKQRVSHLNKAHGLTGHWDTYPQQRSI